MRYSFGFLCVCALGVMPLVGCDISGGQPCFPNPCPDPLCEGVVCEDDGNECTAEYCSRGTCGSAPVEIGVACDWNGVPGVCVEGVCGKNLCEGIVCEDGIECTNDTCDLVDGTCDFRSLCADYNDCTEDICKPLDGLCDFTTLVEDGTECIGAPLAEVGLCEAGVCVTPCDSSSGEAVQCPIEGREDWFCCPGQDECRDVC